tara:strand:- start:127 stop:447 length:321 start_codon:yes stop_codon:yes gene_type:complete
MDIISDMTRQYKSVEEELMEQINRLEQRKTNNEEEIKNLKNKEGALQGEIKEIENKKKNEIELLKKSIEEMSASFAKMLQETLEAMRDKIKKADEKWEEENDGASI